LVEAAAVAERLSLVEREEIAVRWGRGESMRSIAGVLGRAPSTISREIGANTVVWFGGTYRAAAAHAFAVRLRRRDRALRLAASPLRALVVAKLNERWSPRQIAVWLKMEYPDRPELQVSHETIYQSIFVQGRGALRAELKHQKALRCGRTRRRSTAQAGALHANRAWLGLNISQRPAEAADRAVPGHWEGDLLIGKNNRSAIATLVERSTRFVLLVALPEGRASDRVVEDLALAMGRLPHHLRRSLTWDQGSEMARHLRFSIATNCPVYFCDPHSPWQRGSNENTNGLLRDYWPSASTDFTTLTQADLDEVARQLNTRPRMTLNWATPAAKLTQLLTVATAA
jgi:transposase, IS30 family